MTVDVPCPVSPSSARQVVNFQFSRSINLRTEVRKGRNVSTIHYIETDTFGGWRVVEEVVLKKDRCEITRLYLSELFYQKHE